MDCKRNSHPFSSSILLTVLTCVQNGFAAPLFVSCILLVVYPAMLRETDRQTVRDRERERESSNSKTLFSKDCRVCVCVCVCERERDRQTDRRTDRQT